MDIVAIIVASLSVAIVFAAGTSLLGRVCGLRTSSAEVGLGPRIGGFTAGRARFGLRLFPTGSCVRFRDPVLGDEYEGVNPVLRLSIPATAVVMLGPPVALVALGVAVATTSPERSLRLAAIVSIWTGVSCLLPLPSQNGFALLVRLTAPANQLPEMPEINTWASVGALILSMLLGFAVLLVLLVWPDLALGLLDRILPAR